MPEEQQAELSSQASEVHLTCPSSAQIEMFHQEYNLQISRDHFSCAVDDPRAHFYKALATLDRANYKPSADWGLEFSKTTEDILKYIQKYVKKISILDQTQTSTVVNSYPSEHWIEFTDRILELNPIEMISMLVHEVRHIEAPHRVHIRCGPGDMPGTEGACDEILMPYFKDMSSYNFEAYYLAGLSLFSQLLSEEEKATAAETALKLMASRFNNFKDNTVYFHDVVFKLNPDHKLQVWHPYLKQWLIVPTDLGDDRIERIEAANDAFKISVFTQRGKFFTYSLFEGLKPYSESLEGLKVTDATRIVVPNANNDNYMSLLVDGQIKLLLFKDKNGRHQLLDYPFVDTQIKSRFKFERTIYGNFNEVLWLDSEGKLYRKTPEASQTPDLISMDVIDKAGPWKQGGPGLVYEDLYLVNQLGKVYQLQVKNKKTPSYLQDDELQAERYELNPLLMWDRQHVIKFLQGSFGDYILNNRGQIILKRSDSINIENLNTEPAIDFAITKTVIPTGIISDLLKQPVSKFKAKCSLTQAGWDPVFYKGMGVNKSGQLVFAGVNSECLALTSVKDVTGYEFQNVSKRNEKTYKDILKNGINFLSDVELKVKTMSSPVRMK